MFYNTGNPPKLSQLTIPGCETLCPLHQFINLTKTVHPADGESLCNEPKYRIIDFDASLVIENDLQDEQLYEKIQIGSYKSHDILLEKTFDAVT